MFSFGSIPIKIPKEKLGFPLASSQKTETIFRQYKIGPPRTQDDDACVGWAMSNLLKAEPISQTYDPRKIYLEARKRGNLPKSVAGSKITDAVDFLKSEKLVREDFWANDIDQVIQFLFNVSPVCFSLPWYSNMTEVNKNDPRAKLGGSYLGNHAVMAYGFDKLKNRVYFQNSWGSDYGQNGNFYFTKKDLEKLLKVGGIAVALLE